MAKIDQRKQVVQNQYNADTIIQADRPGASSDQVEDSGGSQHFSNRMAIAGLLLAALAIIVPVIIWWVDNDETILVTGLLVQKNLDAGAGIPATHVNFGREDMILELTVVNNGQTPVTLVNTIGKLSWEVKGTYAADSELSDFCRAEDNPNISAHNETIPADGSFTSDLHILDTWSGSIRGLGPEPIPELVKITYRGKEHGLDEYLNTYERVLCVKTEFFASGTPYPSIAGTIWEGGPNHFTFVDE
ncbi:MAG: hypothetical protein GY779_12975 [Gammaproteobacteria bacterium]|nr:hypothetical protein [Gammaproteobacteria bacterium]